MASKDGTHGFSSHSCEGCSGGNFLWETAVIFFMSAVIFLCQTVGNFLGKNLIKRKSELGVMR